MNSRSRTGADVDLGPALDLIRGAQRFLLTGHVRPDGDCIGAQAALARVLGALGKEVRILNTDPPEPRYDYLARDCDYEVFAGGDPPEHDVTVLLDCGELSRCGPLAEPLAQAASRKLVIDHHVPAGEPWWDAALLDPSAAATGLLVRRLAQALDVELDVVAARGVFTSLVSDTGWFRYSNADAETFAAAAELVERGVEPHVVFGAIYQRRSPEHPAFVHRLLGRLEYAGDGRLAVVDQPLDAAFDGLEVDPDEVLDLLRSVGAVEVVLYLREIEGGLCKLSARSKTDYDVHALAKRFGGGGHRKASGATLEGPLREVRARVVAAALEGFEGRPAGGATRG